MSVVQKIVVVVGETGVTERGNEAAVSNLKMIVMPEEGIDR